MKCGLEIHQRLLTHKLFCECPSDLAEDAKNDLTVHRQLRPVASEMGEMDEASKHEFERRKQFSYLVYEKNNCLVELDEEPPHPMNKEALLIALEIALHLNAAPVDEVHMMRKLVIDGSNTCGFQRTAIFALDGVLKTTKGDIGIPTIAIEEESAGIVSAADGAATYRLDRLGIPLVEITTAPDIKDGEHLLEVAEKIGMIMRATGKVARGLGTIRQDVNVSIEGGTRVEVKGAQDLKMLPQFVEFEVKRQENLLQIIAELKKRSWKFKLHRDFHDVTSLFAKTEAKLLKAGIGTGQKVIALKLEQHATLLGREVQPGKRYGTEFSDYAKTAGVKGIIHSDESMEKYGITVVEVAALRTALAMQEKDAFVLVVAEAVIAKKALEKVCQRAEMDFIPKETRRANPDATTTFMRPLPGKARLYPETDIPPIKITEKLLATVEKSESLEDKKKKLLKMLNAEMAEKMIKSKQLALFEKLASEFPEVEPMLIASTLENTLVSLRRSGITLQDETAALRELFTEYAKGTFVKAAMQDIIAEMATGKSVAAAIADKQLQRISGAELKKIIAEHKGDMKAIMAKYRLRIDPKDVK